MANHIPTGVTGLDTVLDGGLIERTTYLLAGAPGTGKTVLSEQLAFNFARKDPANNVLVLTLLAESHEKLINNLSDFSFYDPNLVGQQVQYLSVYRDVTSQGLQQLLPVSRQSVAKYKAKFVILEGVSALRDFAANRLEMRRVIFDFVAQLNNLGCTVFLIVDDEQPINNSPEYGLADTIIRLYHHNYSGQQVRQLEVLKSRAAAALTGQHSFDISKDGISVYPRVEAKLTQTTTYHLDHDKPRPDLVSASAVAAEGSAEAVPRSAFAIDGLDEMLGGGLLKGSINLILGTPGSGKTLTGLRFIYEGAVQGEKGLMLTFHNSPQTLTLSSKQVGFDLDPYVANGTVKILQILPVECLLDKVGGLLLDTIESHQPQRLLIDSVNDLERLTLQRERLDNFWAALSDYFRTRQLTTLGVLNFNQLVGHSLDLPDQPITTIADTILLLRSLEIGGELKRLISVLEMRDSDHGAKVREYLIKTDGLQVGEPFKDADRILSGLPRFNPSRGQPWSS